MIKNVLKDHCYLINGFAGINLKVKIVKIVDLDIGLYEGKLINSSDIKKLKNQGVPVTSKDKNNSFYVYDFQIIKKL